MSRSVKRKTQRIRAPGGMLITGEPSDLDLVRARRAAVTRAVQQERRNARAPAGVTDSTTVAIHTRDRGPFVQYPASANDLAAMLAMMPRGVADGLGAIVLDLAPSFSLTRIGDLDDKDLARDAVEPFTGRRGFFETLPGVYGRTVRGVYSPSQSTIYVCGYLYDPSREDRDFIETVLRVRMLTVFAHEIAHHHARRARVAQRRWIPFRVDRSERYAEAWEAQWARDVVAPYVEQSYPDAVARLDAWMVRHGGVRVPLEVLSATGGGGPFPLCDAVDELYRSVQRGHDASTTRYRFAFDLHYSHRWDDALEALDRLLADTPGHTDARVLRAHVLLHRGRCEEALASMRAVVARDPGCTDAWRVLAAAHDLAGEHDAARAARAHVPAGARPNHFDRVLRGALAE